MHEFNEQYLKDRISPYSNQWLLIFFNRPLMNWYEKYLKYRDDIIYITHNEIVNGGLVGLRYYNYKFMDQAYTKEDLEKIIPIIKRIGDNK